RRPPRAMPGYLDSLNERQRRAVCHENGGALVLAGAGTGKTRVLTSRIAWLTGARGCSPREVLAVTFTNKAAKEMRRRVCELTPFPPGNFAPGTFHGVCHRMLRIHANAAGWDKNFQILDSSDQKTFVRRLLADDGIDAAEFPPAECVRYINAAKDRGLRPGDISEQYARGQAMREIYDRYENACRRENKMDFAELLLSAIDLLRGDGNLRAHYAARFRHILIDEFQDTSPLQYRWLRLLDSGENCFFAVGDDDQSIYAFRGADPENMRRVQSELRAREIIRLEQNYRSTGNILSAANTLISANKNRLGKTLFTDAGDGAPILLRRAAADLDEADDIAYAAKNEIADGARADEIAVLYRTNAQSRLLEEAMRKYALPYRIYGGTRFFDRLEIRHALAYLRLAVADDRDALLRVINTPPRGIGAKTIESLEAHGDIFSALLRREYCLVGESGGGGEISWRPKSRDSPRC
ncbi:MAG: ATP-dependent helicase, partial [Gammaproteobacteria bacterium]